MAGPLGTPLGLAQRKRASPRGEAWDAEGTSSLLFWKLMTALCLLQGKERRESEEPKSCGRTRSLSPTPEEKCLNFESVHNVPLQGRQGSRVCITDSPRELGLVSRGSKGLGSPLELRRAPAPSIQYRASNLDWRLVSYMILYVFQCHSPKSSHPLPLPQPLRRQPCG